MQRRESRKSRRIDNLGSHRSSSPTKISNLAFIQKDGDIQLRRLPRTGRELARKISNRTAKVGIVGLGYAGLALAMEMAEEGFQVIGIDTDRGRVESVNAGISYHIEVGNKQLFSLVSKNKLTATHSLAIIESLNVVIVCTQRFLTRARGQNFTNVTAMAEMLSNHLRSGQLVSLDFPGSPGMTRKVMAAILGRSRLRVGQDFFLVYTGNEDAPPAACRADRKAPRVIGGVTPQCGALGKLLFGQGRENTVVMSSADCAEMVALFEHSFFGVNSALVMEMALTCHRLGLDIREVIDAARKKGFGFLPFDPAINDHYHHILADATASIGELESQGVHRQLMDAAMQINGQIPAFIVARVAEVLNESQRSVKGSNILALGVTPNHNKNELQKSLVIEVLEALRAKGAIVHYTDPYVPSLSLKGHDMRSQPLSADILRRMDCIILLTDHSDFDYETIATHSAIILDCCNALKGISTGTIIPL